MSETLILLGLAFLGFMVTLATLWRKDLHPIVHFSPQPASLPIKTGEKGEVQHVSFRTLLETRCKSLFTEFRPLWWIFKCVTFEFQLDLSYSSYLSGHLQTMYCIFGDFSKNDRMWYDR